MPTARSAISSRVTVQNPRPRKYASAAERQKALRERFPTLCVRVEQKQADFVKRIADEIGRTQQDVHLAMVKYALSRPNNQWLTQGLEGFKPLPQFQEGVMTLWRFNKVTGYWIPERKVTAETKEQWLEIFQEDNPDDTFVVSERKPRNAPVKENPMKRKPTPAQIAARERFAEMARSGAFKRKRNPAKKTVSQKISQLTREGYPQKQAIAIALSEEREGKVKRNPAPRGFVKADDYTIEVFNKYGMKPYDAVYMQTKGGRGEPIYDLTILKHENGKYLAAHGSVIVKQEFDRVSDAAAYLEEWYINNRRPAARRINPRASNPIILVSDKPKRVTRKSNPAKPKRVKVQRPFYYVVKVGSAYDGQFLSTHYSLEDVKKIAQQKADKYGAQAKITEFHM